MRTPMADRELLARDEKFMAFSTSFCRWAAAFAFVVGAVTLVGWFFDIRLLLWTSPGQIVMKANAALAFVLSGISLWLIAGENATGAARQVAAACALAAALLGVLTLCEHATGWNLGIDQLLVAEPPGAVKTVSPGRMAPNAALIFALLGTSMFLLCLRRGYWAVSIMAFVGGAVGLLAVLGYTYATEPATGLIVYTHIALQTALAITVLATGVLLATRGRGLMEPLSRDSVGSVMARRLVPAVVAVPLLLEWLRHRGEHERFFNDEFGIALMVVSSMAVLTLVVWRSAVVLNRIDLERNRALASLSAEERFRKTLEDSILTGIVVTDTRRRIIHVNPAFCRIVGREKEELVGATPPYPFQHPEDRGIIPTITAAIRGNRLPTEGLELRLVRPGGETVDVAVLLSPLRDARGTLVGALGALTDITDRKRQERELARATEVLETIFSNVQFMVVYLDARFNFIRVNPSYAEACGHPPDFFPGRNHFDLYPNAENEAIFRRAVATGEPFAVFAKPFEFPDRAERRVTYWDWNLQPVKEADGTVSGLIFCLRDVTENVRAQSRLRESEQRLEASVDAAELGLWDWNAGSASVVCNEKWARRLGYFPEETEPGFASWEELIHPEDLPGALAEFNNHLEGRTPFYEAEFRMRANSGEWRRIYSRGMVFERDGEGAPLRATGIHQDVTRSRELEQAALQHEKMAILGQLAAGIAHEIRNPLSGLNIYLAAAETLSGDLEFPDPASRQRLQRALGTARSASVKIEGVIRRVMDFVKPVLTRPGLIQVNEVVAEAVEMAATTVRKSGVRLATTLAEALPPCRADFRLLEQLLLNLITNAVQSLEAKPGDKTIEIATGMDKGRIAITVGDSGPGVPEHLREKIFEPFFTTKSSGTGLGLSISRRIVAEHGGAIEVGTSRLGGAEFRILFPVGN